MQSKLNGFTEAKQRITEAIDFRVKVYKEMKAKDPNFDTVEYDVRVQELLSLRKFVRGMVTLTDYEVSNEQDGV